MSSASHPSHDAHSHRRFTIALMAVVAFLALLPNLIAMALAPPGSVYIGSTFNTDDHMVYSAWIHQSMEGRFFFENLFTTEPQPGLTVHLYFWLLGKVALFAGVIGAMALARVVFSVLFVWMLARMLSRSGMEAGHTKITLLLTVFGGGFGVVLWHNFGRLLERPETLWAKPLTAGWQSNDIWQPEIFVFPSMLTNGLFMVSLCLMLCVVDAVVRSKDSWGPVLGGTLAFGVLMNIHSYDVLTLALAMFGLLVMAIRRKSLNSAWLWRVLVISAGILPAAGWFVHVLNQDQVFAARAATPTPMSPFGPLLVGLLPIIALAMIGFLRRDPVSGKVRAIAWAPVVFLVLSWVAFENPFGEALRTRVWAVLLLVALAALITLDDDDLLTQFMCSWAFTGLIAPYFPADFQRKLAAGLVIPWAFLAGKGLIAVLARFEKQQRPLVTGVLVCAACLTSVLWLRRDLQLIRDDVSTTTVQTAFLTKDTQAILDRLRQERAADPNQVVLALPGIPSKGTRPDSFSRPQVMDLNPVITGLTGARTYAGHWSETPDYARRRSEVMSVMVANTPEPEVNQVLRNARATLVIAPNWENPEEAGLRDVRSLGEVLHEGPEWLLVRLDR